MTVLITRRTLRRTHLLRPDPDLNNLYLYCLAIAAERHEIAVHCVTVMSSHEHLVVTDTQGTLPLFLQELHRLLALCIKVLRKWEGAVWDHDRTSVVELRTEQAVLEKIAYCMAVSVQRPAFCSSRRPVTAFERIGQESSTTIERRISSLVEVTVVRPKFRAKTIEAQAAVQQARQEAGTLPEQPPESWITVAPVPELPLPRSMAGPGLLANVAVRRFDEHLPYNRLENVYEREGMRLGRSTLYGWLDALRELLSPLLAAILADARNAPYLCVDATGVLVQAPEKCSRGHFWVLVVPGRHVVFAFSHSHDSEAVDKLLGGYGGFVVADAHAVYDHLYGDDGASEVGCWGHARSYFFKAFDSEPEIAREVLANLRVMFMLERKLADDTRKNRERMRTTKVKVLVDRHFELCTKHEDYALDGTPLRAAIRYSLNQEQALRRFLSDGRLPATNNISERNLRRQAVGRRNWLFVGSDDGAEVNTTFATLIASCHLHDIEPESYLRELICLVPDWPKSRILELAPCNWKQTRQQPQAQQLIADNIWLFALSEIDAFHARSA